MENIFKNEAANENNPKWSNLISRQDELYSRKNDNRSEFERDCNRIIHSLAYRRMKHKTQVFFSPSDDHICTRMEHVILVESISHTIAKCLGLNTELTKAIAMGHDMGHSPFGHQGERELSKISKREIGKTFWHERNSMEIMDKIELLEDHNLNLKNLNLTYAVRDGIISHCGEIDENGLKPRDEYIDLYDYEFPNQYRPYTWEGCVVKISDKIAYLGRDIQDAITVGILDKHLKELYDIIASNTEENIINNTIIIKKLIYDLCENSNLEDGLKFSDKTFNFMNQLKDFNVKYIYMDDRLKPSTEYFALVLNTLYDTLKKYYTNNEKLKKMYPKIYSDFENWLKMYWKNDREKTYNNKALFDINNEKDICQAIIFYISCMTDNYAVDTFNQIVGF